MQNIWVEPATKEDAPALLSFMDATENNLYDDCIYKYPATETVKASKDGVTLLFMPRQSAFVLESLAINPDNNATATSAALKAVMQVVVWDANKRGMGEVYFACRDESTAAFAMRHGFERFEFPMYRMKL